MSADLMEYRNTDWLVINLSNKPLTVAEEATRIANQYLGVYFHFYLRSNQEIHAFPAKSNKEVIKNLNYANAWIEGVVATLQVKGL